MEKYFKYLESQDNKIKKHQKEEDKKRDIIFTLFESIIPSVFRNIESQQEDFEFINDRKTFEEDFVEYKVDVFYLQDYEHVYTLSIKLINYYLNFENMFLTLVHENGAAPSKFGTDYMTIDKKGFENALSEVFIRMDQHRCR